MPDGSSHGASGHRASTESFFESSTATSLLSSMLTKTRPFPSACANSGFPPRGIVQATFPVAASIDVASPDRPLNVKTRPEAAS